MEKADKDQAAILLLVLAILCCHAVSAQEADKSSIAVGAGPSGAPARQATQADPGNALRIYRPAGGFKPDSGNDSAPAQAANDSIQSEPSGTEPVFSADRVWADPITSANVAQDPTSPAFAQALDGFSARWHRRLGTPLACAMVLCQGSCAASEAPCELVGSWRGESAGCAAMPEGATGMSSGCSEATEGCDQKPEACAGKDQGGAEKHEACAGNEQSCAAKHEACATSHDKGAH